MWVFLWALAGAMAPTNAAAEPPDIDLADAMLYCYETGPLGDDGAILDTCITDIKRSYAEFAAEFEEAERRYDKIMVNAFRTCWQMNNRDWRDAYICAGRAKTDILISRINQ